MSQHDGEKELVLGNKQLLAIFFVGTLLCGVFFAMGYVVGGNSKSPGADTSAASTADGKVEEPRAARDSPLGTAPTSPTGDAGGPLPGAEPRMADNPAAAGALPPPSAATAAPAPVSPPVTAAVTAPPSKESASASGALPVSTPEKDADYLQVGALIRSKAEDQVRILRERGLPSILAESSQPDRFRILVGPYRSSLSEADAMKKLKALGYGDVIVHKQ